MLTVFQDGLPADRDLINATFNSIQAQGSSLLSSLTDSYTDDLLLLERRLSALNARRRLANRTSTLRTLANLETTDFQDIDQANTTSTVRIDAGSATLRERNLPANISIASTIFTSDQGYANQFGDLYQVYLDTPNQSPTGTFTIQLFQPVNASLIIFDIAATPSVPVISVSVSADGNTYTLASRVSIEGYRISAFLPATSVKYIKLVLTPSHADNLDGSTFTFGITATSMSAVQYQLSSELSSRPILIKPNSSSFRFIADADPGVLFYLSLNGGAFSQVASGDSVQVPGAVDANLTPITIDPSHVGVLLTTLSDGIYPASIAVSDAATGIPYSLLPGLDPSASGVSGLLGKYIAVHGTSLTLVPQSSADNAKSMTVKYTTGPASVSVQVRVLLTTPDRSVTPAFRGASFQEI